MDKTGGNQENGDSPFLEYVPIAFVAAKTFHRSRGEFARNPMYSTVDWNVARRQFYGNQWTRDQSKDPRARR